LGNCIYFLTHYIWVNPKEFKSVIEGSYTNKDLEKNAEIAAGILSMANIFDFFSTQGVFYFVLSSTPLYLGAPLSLILNLLVLMLKNWLGVGVVREFESNFQIRVTYLFTLIVVSGTSCIGSFIGTELSLNEKGLAQLYAKQLIDEKIQGLENNVKAKQDEYDEVNGDCKKGREILYPKDKQNSKLKLSRNYFNSEYRRTLGENKDSQKVWKLSDPGIPLCPKALRLTIVMTI
jgi:hypothetical protein